MNHEKLNDARNLLFVALSVDMIVSAAVIMSDLWMINVFDSARHGSGISQSTLRNINFWDNFAYITLLTAIGVGLGLTHWLSQCYEYAKESLKATSFVYEHWRIAGWLVPIINLFKPYQVINEIYKAGSSDYVDQSGWKKTSDSGWLLAWWLFWVFSHVLMALIIKIIKNQSTHGDPNLNQIFVIYQFNIVVCLISLVVAGLWFVVARKITERLLNRAIQTDGVKATMNADYSHSQLSHQNESILQQKLGGITDNYLMNHEWLIITGAVIFIVMMIF